MEEECQHPHEPAQFSKEISRKSKGLKVLSTCPQVSIIAYTCVILR